MIKFFQPGLGYLVHKQEIDREIERVLTNGDLILRQDVEDFEKNLAEFVGTKYAVGLNSGTDALYIALKIAGIGPGDEVITSSHTFVATAQVIELCGATPVLYDKDDSQKLSNIFSLVTPKTAAIIPCHIAGEFGMNMKSLMKLAKDNDLLVIEDACQSLGAIQDGKSAGTWGLAGAFSFYPAKILGAYGDAGALVTDSEYVYKEAIELRNHYKKDYSKWGINSRLDNLQAAILNIKMKYLPDTLFARQKIAEMYSAGLKGVGLPKHRLGRVWQDYIIQTPRRDELYEYLKAKGIETMKNEYPFPIAKGPLSLKFEAETLRLPINEILMFQQVKEIIDAINNF